MARASLSSYFTLKLLLAVYTVVIILFIYSPIAALFAFSFKGGGASIGLPYPHTTLMWYERFFRNPTLTSALFRSVQIGLYTMGITTVLCIVTSLALRKRFPGRDMLFYLIMLGIIIPGIVYGVGSAIFFGTYLNITPSMWTVVPIEVVWALPFGLILMLARFDPDLLKYEQAASTLGASRWRVLREITFPLIFPQIMAAALFAFTLSFGELMRALFVSGATDVPLSVIVYGYVANQPATPEYFALGTIVTVISMILLVGAGVLMTRGPGKKLF